MAKSRTEIVHLESFGGCERFAPSGDASAILKSSDPSGLLFKPVNRRNKYLFTARKRSLGQGYIFRSVCQEFCPRGGRGYPSMPCRSHWGMDPPGHAPPGKEVPPWQGSTPSGRKHPAWEGGTPLPARKHIPPARKHPLGKEAPTLGRRQPPNGYCCGRYASYWNAFLLKIFYQQINVNFC